MIRSASFVRVSLKLPEFSRLKVNNVSCVLFNPSAFNAKRNFSLFKPQSNVASVILLEPKLTSLIPTSLALTTIMSKRSMSSQEITKNLRLYTEQQRKIIADPNTLRLTQDCNDKPLVVILSWLLAKQKHLSKFAKIYLDQGFDVLVTQITPWQLLWPSKGSQQVASDIVKFMEANDYYKQMILHGFSVGGYVWGECLAQMEKDQSKYQSIIERRIIGQIWDSAADITEIPIGVPKAMFPRNPKLENALKNYMLYHLKTFHEAATQHYVRSSQLFHTHKVLAPALFFVSKTDPVGSEASNRRVADSWVSNGIDVTWKVFDHSPHVSHFYFHREEYLASLFEHLRKVDLLKHPKQSKLLRANL